MAAQSESVRKFYNELNVKLNFTTRFNTDTLTERINSLVDQLSDEIKKRYYGSGISVPEHLKGARILDMGCGSGSLVFILSKLVGPEGYVVGVDLTDGLVETAKQESEYHYKKWGYDKANFEFHCGNINNITDMGFEDGSFDAIVSNGVFCLCPDKSIPFNQAYRLLKPGGQFLLSDVFGEVPQPDELKNREKMWCLGIGCLLWNELAPTCQKAGFTTPYLQQSAAVNIKNEEVKKDLKNAEYLCSTNRLFKLPQGVKRGPATVTYLGNIEEYPESLPWDVDLTFKKGQPVAVDAELATILAFTAFSTNFTIEDFSGNVTTNRNQNPFQHLRDLIKKGQGPPFVYDVE